MRRLFLYISCICLALLSFLQVRAERIDTLLHFNLADLRIDTVTAPDGQKYTCINYPHLDLLNTPQQPMLPVKYLSITVPYNAENISLRYNTANTNSETITSKVFPAQAAAPMKSALKDISFMGCEERVYTDTCAFPAQNAKITEIVSGGLKEKKVGIAVFPIQYFPTQNHYEFSGDIHISLSYKLSSKSATQSNVRTLSSLPHYEYCVITNYALKDSFRRLIAWKRQKGLDAGVVCVEDIITDATITKDVVSNITDSAGQVRQYIKESYENFDTKYVLLGGNEHIVPVRYGTWHEWHNIDEEQIPTDYYYSELYSNWNVDNDQYYGEPTDDQLINNTQVYVGRILCANAEDVENYTNKLLRYEMNPGNGNFSYLRKALFHEFGYAQEDSLGYKERDALQDIFPNNIVLSAGVNSSSGATGRFVIAILNNHYGYANFLGRAGETHGITVKQVNENNIYIIASKQGAVPGAVQEIANGLNNLNNKLYPMIAYSNSSFNAAFDIHHINGVLVPNIVESFTLGKDYGGPAFIGNTRYGLYLPNSQHSSISYYGLSYTLAKRFNEYIHDSENTICMAFRASLESYPSLDFCKHYLVMSTNYLGCPELRMWTDTPQTFSASIDEEEQAFYVNPSITDANIAMRDISTDDEDLNITYNYDFSGDGTYSGVDYYSQLITLTGINCQPQILPLIIHEPNMQGTHYLFTKDAICSGVDGYNACFKSGSDFTFEKSGKFTLGKNTKIEAGAKFKIITSDINY